MIIVDRMESQLVQPIFYQEKLILRSGALHYTRRSSLLKVRSSSIAKESILRYRYPGKEYTSSKIPWGQSPADSDRPQTLQQRRGSSRIPVEDLDDHDMDARREMLEAMRSFGINDPAINDLRYEDPALLHGQFETSSKSVTVTPDSNGSNDEDDMVSSPASSVASTHFVNSFGSRRSSIATSVESDCSPSVPSGFLQGSPRTGGSLSTVRSPRITATEDLIPEEDENELEIEMDPYPMHRDEFGVITFFSKGTDKERVYPIVEAKEITPSYDITKGMEAAFRPGAFESSDEEEDDSNEDKESHSSYTTSVRILVQQMEGKSKAKVS